MPELEPPPSNKEAEIAVLGAVLLEGELIDKVHQKLQPEDFYTTAHRTIIKTMFGMYKENIAIDIVTLPDRLSGNGVLNDIGGSIYLTELTEMTPTSANIDYYIKLVKDASELRNTYEVCQKLTYDINNKKINADKAKQKLENFIYTSDIRDKDSEIIQLSQEPTPEPREWLLENLIPKDFPTTIYASGGVGKSFISISLGLNACIGNTEYIGKHFYPKPLNTLFIDYELEKGEIMRRAIELCNGMGLKKIPDNFYYQLPELRISKCLEKLRFIIKRFNIELVIIDSMGASGVDAMDEKSVILIYSKLKELGITSILIDHQSKLQTQDNPENKSPFGSVYKSNMSRSVLHLIGEKNIKGFLRIRLVHNKSNFGAKSEEILIDIHFDTGVVVIENSDSLTRTEQQMCDIRNYMLGRITEGERLNQRNLVEYFEGSIGKERVRSLLEKGNTKFWNTSKGVNNSIIYEPIESV